MNRTGFCSLLLIITLGLFSADSIASEYPPTDWGTDHIGQAIPNYVTGDECLFCHRKIGPNWPANAHQLTVQPKPQDAAAIAALQSIQGGKSVAAEVQLLMNSGRVTRFLKRSKEYGKLELLNIAWLPNSATNPAAHSSNTISGFASFNEKGEATRMKTPKWDKEIFGERCAGCHATAVDFETKAFSALSLDCFTCHGNVNLQHTQNVKQVLLSKTNREPRQVISICGQCHLRGGTSKSTGLPYANTFVAGDNLFRDFQVDLSITKIDRLPAVEKHIFRNTREVTMFGSKTTCLACHNIHDQNTDKHQELAEEVACFDCHVRKLDDFELSDGFTNSRKTSSPGRVCNY